MTWKPAHVAPPSMPGSAWSTWQFVLSALAGLASATVPVALLIAYVVSFTISTTPDGFNVFTVGALASVVVVVGLCVGAAVLTFKRTARSTGIGYLTGVAVVAMFAGLLSSVWL
jgi:hypothetical protein